MGDSSPTPFRVDILPVYGKPPMYTVVMLSAAKEPLRKALGQLFHRSFNLGVGSFTLRVTEPALLISKYGPKG